MARLLAASGLERPGPGGITDRDVARLTIACFDGAFTVVQMDADAADVRRMFTLLYTLMTAALRCTQTPQSE
jgi:hypothetical protein